MPSMTLYDRFVPGSRLFDFGKTRSVKGVKGGDF